MADELKFSDDAKAVLGAWFGMGKMNTLTLHLVQSQPTPRVRAALDELVAAGALSKEPFNRHGGEVYNPLIETLPYFRWLTEHQDDPALKFPMMEPIPQKPPKRRRA